MSQKKNAGDFFRGLIAGIPVAERTHPSEKTEVLLSALVARKGQPRRYFNEETLEELAGSIREKGVLQPLLVRPLDDERYEVIAGERRFRAARLAGLRYVPVRVQVCTDEEADQLALIENLQREDLDRFEDVSFKLKLVAGAWGVSETEAKTQLRRLRKHPEESPDKVEQVENLFRLIGGEKWSSFVANGLPALDLPESLLQVVQEGRLQYSKAVLIARAPQEHRQALLDAVLQEGLSFEALRAQIAGLKPGLRPGTREQHLQVVRKHLTPRALEKLPADRQARADELVAELARLFS